MYWLSGKTALVTGASRGIGRAIAQRLARDGARVAVNFANNADAAQWTVDSITSAGGQAVAIQAAVGDQEATDKLFTALAGAGFDHLDILVNNAGIGRFRTVAQTTEADLDGLFAVNLKGPFLVTRAALPLMPDGGRIVNISSGASRRPIPQMAAYSMTKAAVNAFSELLGAELGPRRITVNTVAPGWTETDANAAARADEDLVARVERSTALGRFGQPTEIADVVAFLVSVEAGWITGQYIEASGGYLLNVT